MNKRRDSEMLVGRDYEAAFRGIDDHDDNQERERRANDNDFDHNNNNIIIMTSDAVLASLPILLKRLVSDSKDLVLTGSQKLWNFILPDWDSYYHSSSSNVSSSTLPSLKELLQSASNNAANTPLGDFMLRHFDTNGDGHISRQELLHMTEVWKHTMQEQAATSTLSWATWFQREWPLMDWKIGFFLWSTFGGILYLLAGVSIIPGRMHGISAKILRWPVLGVVYFLIVVDFV